MGEDQAGDAVHALTEHGVGGPEEEDAGRGKEVGVGRLLGRPKSVAVDVVDVVHLGCLALLVVKDEEGGQVGLGLEVGRSHLRGQLGQLVLHFGRRGGEGNQACELFFGAFFGAFFSFLSVSFFFFE